ncbi:MAG: hypothetical protein P1V36_05105 [Planctomycetota bacterium]|nr:hypothetical protein [Planctomycetota bacterium]
MKTAVVLLVACAAILAVFAVPRLAPPAIVEARDPNLVPTPMPRGETPELAGEDVDPGTADGNSCRLVVLSQPATIADRGTLAALGEAHTLQGSYRYQEEPLGRVLYVWDDVQNLVTRIVNPARVLRFDATP